MDFLKSVLFVEKLNRLAEKTEIHSKFYPFSDKPMDLIKENENDFSDFVLYDDEKPTDVLEGAICYPLVNEVCVDSEHDDIVSYEENAFVCFDEDDTTPYIVVFPFSVYEERVVYETYFVVEDGKWYSV